MNEKFFDLKKEKQDRIINGALKVFGMNGYRHASTDDIVREARISKGLLFHYFISKQGTYAFVLEFLMRFWGMELEGKKQEPEDGFAAFLQREQIRVQMLKRYPYFHIFMEKCKMENEPEVLSVLRIYRNELYMADMEPYAYRIETDLPKGCTQEDLFAIIEMTIQGILREYDKTLIMTGESDTEKLMEEITSFVEKIRSLTLT